MLNQVQKLFLLGWIPCLVFIWVNCFVFYGRVFTRVDVANPPYHTIVSSVGVEAIVVPVVLGVVLTVLLVYWMGDKFNKKTEE